MMMKKLKIYLIVAFTFLLVACQAPLKKTTYTWSQETTGIKTTFILTSKDDLVLEQETSSTLDYTKLGVTKAQIETTVRPISEQYNKTRGVVHTYDVTDTQLIEKIKIDYTNLDFESLAKLPGNTFTKPVNNNSKVSLKETETLLTKMGAVKQP